MTLVNNNYRFILTKTNQAIDIPIEIKWDFHGRNDSIEIYEDEVVEEIIGSPKDYEIMRFGHNTYDLPPLINLSEINYKFFFFPLTEADLPTATTLDWISSYTASTFTGYDAFYKTDPLKKSFFKLDFYDTTSTTTQKNYFTIILSTDGPISEIVTISPYITNVEITIPEFPLDYIGQKEGFFIYWLRDRRVLNLSTFYMTAKFFDAKNGQFVKMMTVPQATLPEKYLFPPEIYFYKRVELNYSNYTYEIYDTLTGVRDGLGTPINWYEYVNPPQ